jgi:hypothetical protein
MIEKMFKLGGRMLRKRLTVIAGGTVVLALTGVLLVSKANRASATPTVTVYKSPTCGCCTKWVEYMRRQGFRVKAHDVQQMGIVKGERGIPRPLQSCHTADVEGYVIEGHVPSDVIQDLLAKRPPVSGLAVPGMPAGSPGMEGGRRERYDVIAFTQAGATMVYAQRGF